MLQTNTDIYRKGGGHCGQARRGGRGDGEAEEATDRDIARDSGIKRERDKDVICRRSLRFSCYASIDMSKRKVVIDYVKINRGVFYRLCWPPRRSGGWSSPCSLSCVRSSDPTRN